MFEDIYYLQVSAQNNLSRGQISDINILLTQLSGKAVSCSGSWIQKVAEDEFFVIALYAKGKDPVRVVGMALLCTTKNLCGGHIGYIHEVVVHRDFRRRGIMTKLMEMLHDRAKAMGLDTIELTSDPGNEDRQKAIQGYLKMGYRIRETAVFVYDLRGAKLDPV